MRLKKKELLELPYTEFIKSGTFSVASVVMDGFVLGTVEGV